MADNEQTRGQVLFASAAGYSAGANLVLPKRRKVNYKKLREMRTDPTVALGRWLSCAPIVASGWTVEANQDAPDGAKEFVDKQLQSIRLSLLRVAVYGMVDFGWQPFEKVTQIMPDSGLIGIKKLKPLIQDFTEILVDKDTGAYAGLKNYDTELLAEDTLTFSFEPEGTDWYGQPVLDNVWAPYEKWNNIEAAAARYDEKIAGTHLVVYYPNGQTPVNGTMKDNVIIANEILDAWQSSGAFAIPTNVSDFVTEQNKDSPNAWKVELLTDSSAGRGAFVERQKYLDNLKVRGFGLPERTVLEGQYGTKAESEAHGDFAIVNMELRHLDICQTINWHLVNPVLLAPNWGQQFENTVWVTPNPIADAGKAFLRQLFTTLLANPEAGLLLTADIDFKQLQHKLGIPTKEPTKAAPAITQVDEGVPLLTNPTV